MAKITTTIHLKQFTTPDCQNDVDVIYKFAQKVKSFLPGFTTFTNHNREAFDYASNAYPWTIIFENSFYTEDITATFYAVHNIFEDLNIPPYVIEDYTLTQIDVKLDSTNKVATPAGWASYSPTFNSPAYNQTPIPKNCACVAIDIGFQRRNLVCKFCDKDMN